MAKSNFVTIESVIIALTEAGTSKQSKRTAKEILTEIKRVFPTSNTSLKSIYSTVCRENISMPGSNRSAVNIEAYKELMAKLNPAKTGTNNSSK